MRARNITKTVPADDLDLIRRVLDFANLKAIESQEQVYSWFANHPFVHRQQQPDGTVLPVLQALRPEQGVDPFIEDQRALKAALSAVAKRDSRGMDRARDQVIQTLGRTFAGHVRLHWSRGSFEIGVEPSFTSVEALLWYAIAAIFHHELERLIKQCKAVIHGAECGRFFLFTPTRRKYCNESHGEIGRQQAVLAAVKNWQQRHPKAEKKRGGRSRRKSAHVTKRRKKR